MKRKYSVFHNNSDIKNALLLFGQGWTTKRIAKKMKVTETTMVTTEHEVTISLTAKLHKNLVDLATYEVRTVSDQVKSLVHRELERIERNSKNIPF